MFVRQKNLFWVGLLASGLVLMGCTHDDDSKPTVSHISVRDTLASGAISPEKSETLAKQAEELLTADGFQEASKVADLALVQDPTNIRAGLIKAMVAPALQLRGIFTRIRPLAETTATSLQSYENSLKELNQKPDSALKKFWLDGEQDIHTEAELQHQMDLIAEAFENLRLYIKKIKTNEITIKANLALVPDLNARYAASCEIKESPELEYELVCPPSENRYNITLNEADFGVLQDQLSFYGLALKTYTSYDLSGALATYKKKDGQGDFSISEVVDDLLKNPSFGRLRPQANLAQVKEWALDYASGLRWAMAHQDTLCPNGYGNSRNRPGKLFPEGTCTGPGYVPFIEMIESAVTKDMISVTSQKDMKTHTTVFKAKAFFETPLSDIRKLAPFRFDKCSQIIGVGDPTLGGFLPAGDANEVISLRVDDCNK